MPVPVTRHIQELCPSEIPALHGVVDLVDMRMLQGAVIFFVVCF